MSTLKGYQFLNEDNRIIAYYMFKDCELVINDTLLEDQNIDINSKVDEIVKDLQENKHCIVLGISHK